MGFRGQRPRAGQDFEKGGVFFDLYDFCDCLDSSSKAFRVQGPPAGQDSTK